MSEKKNSSLYTHKASQDTEKGNAPDPISAEEFWIPEAEETEDGLKKATLHSSESSPSHTSSPSGRRRSIRRRAAYPEKRPEQGRQERGRHQRETYFHYAVIGVIAFLFVFAAVRLAVWNIGKDSGYDPNEDTSEFDMEALDYIQPLDPELLEGREDDGVDTIVCLGNAPFADDRGPDGLAAQIASLTGATVHNCAFPGSYLSMKNQEYSDSFPQDALSLYLTTASFCGGDYALMEHAAGLMGEQSANAKEALDTLKSVDFSAVDMIVIMYDLSDYKDGRPVMDVNNDINLLTWNGALNASLQHIQQTFPHIRLVVLSPAYGQFQDEDGKMVNSDTTDFGNGVLADYVLHEIDVATANGVSILDNYYGTVNQLNFDGLLTDGYHLTSEGRKRVAERFAEKIFFISKEE